MVRTLKYKGYEGDYLTCRSVVDPGMRLSELVVWYLEQIESDISADQLDYEHTVVDKVIKRLLKTVSVHFEYS